MTGDTYGIVASSRSKFGGTCTECHAVIRRGERIHKVGTTGPTTKSGQGPGHWIGDCCVHVYEEDK